MDWRPLRRRNTGRRKVTTRCDERSLKEKRAGRKRAGDREI